MTDNSQTKVGSASKHQTQQMKEKNVPETDDCLTSSRRLDPAQDKVRVVGGKTKIQLPPSNSLTVNGAQDKQSKHTASNQAGGNTQGLIKVVPMHSLQHTEAIESPFKKKSRLATQQSSEVLFTENDKAMYLEDEVSQQQIVDGGRQSQRTNGEGNYSQQYQPAQRDGPQAHKNSKATRYQVNKQLHHPNTGKGAPPSKVTTSKKLIQKQGSASSNTGNNYVKSSWQNSQGDQIGTNVVQSTASIEEFLGPEKRTSDTEQESSLQSSVLLHPRNRTQQFLDGEDDSQFDQANKAARNRVTDVRPQENNTNSILIESPPPASRRRKGSFAQLSSSLIKYKDPDTGEEYTGTEQIKSSRQDEDNVFTEEFTIPFGPSRSQLEQNQPTRIASKNKKIEPMTVKPKQFSKKQQLVGYAQQEPPSDHYADNKYNATTSGKQSPNNQFSAMPESETTANDSQSNAPMMRSFIIRKATSSSINFNQQQTQGSSNGPQGQRSSPTQYTAQGQQYPAQYTQTAANRQNSDQRNPQSNANFQRTKFTPSQVNKQHETSGMGSRNQEAADRRRTSFMLQDNSNQKQKGGFGAIENENLETESTQHLQHGKQQPLVMGQQMHQIRSEQPSALKRRTQIQKMQVLRSSLENGTTSHNNQIYQGEEMSGFQAQRSTFLDEEQNSTSVYQSRDGGNEGPMHSNQPIPSKSKLMQKNFGSSQSGWNHAGVQGHHGVANEPLPNSTTGMLPQSSKGKSMVPAVGNRQEARNTIRLGQLKTKQAGASSNSPNNNRKTALVPNSFYAKQQRRTVYGQGFYNNAQPSYPSNKPNIGERGVVMVVPPSANAKNRAPHPLADGGNQANQNTHYFNVRGDSQLLRNKKKLPANHLVPIQTPEGNLRDVLPGSRQQVTRGTMNQPGSVDKPDLNSRNGQQLRTRGTVGDNFNSQTNGGPGQGTSSGGTGNRKSLHKAMSVYKSGAGGVVFQTPNSGDQYSNNGGQVFDAAQRKGGKFLSRVSKTHIERDEHGVGIISDIHHQPGRSSQMNMAPINEEDQVGPFGGVNSLIQIENQNHPSRIESAQHMPRSRGGNRGIHGQQEILNQPMNQAQQIGMDNNIFTVHGDQIDHFPIARANRWQGQNPNPTVKVEKGRTGASGSGNFRNNGQPENAGGRGFGGVNYGKIQKPQTAGGGGVKITINKDNSHLQAGRDGLSTEQSNNMSLLLYDFNNPTVVAEAAVAQQIQTRCHTTDRGPSRKFHERARLRLASSQNQRVTDENAGQTSGQGHGEMMAHRIGGGNSTQQNFQSPYQPMGIKQISSREAGGANYPAAAQQQSHQTGVGSAGNSYRKGCSTSQQPRRAQPFEPIFEQTTSPYEKDNVFSHKNSSKQSQNHHKVQQQQKRQRSKDSDLARGEPLNAPKRTGMLHHPGAGAQFNMMESIREEETYMDVTDDVL